MRLLLYFIKCPYVNPSVLAPFWFSPQSHLARVSAWLCGAYLPAGLNHNVFAEFPFGPIFKFISLCFPAKMCKISIWILIPQLWSELINFLPDFLPGLQSFLIDSIDREYTKKKQATYGEWNIQFSSSVSLLPVSTPTHLIDFSQLITWTQYRKARSEG